MEYRVALFNEVIRKGFTKMMRTEQRLHTGERVIQVDSVRKPSEPEERASAKAQDRRRSDTPEADVS